MEIREKREKKGKEGGLAWKKTRIPNSQKTKERITR